MKFVRLFVLIAIVALVAQGLGTGTPAKAQDNVIKIVSHSPLSVKSVELGTAIRNGTELAIKLHGKAITDAGFELVFEPKDDQGDQARGTANAQDIVNDPAILAVIGHLNSGIALPASVIYDKAGLVMISPANTNVQITDRGLPTVNRVCGRDDAQGAAGANYATGELKVKSVYVIHDKTAYGEGVATPFRDSIEAAGVEVLGFEGTEEKSNFDAILTPVLAQSPELIYYGGLYDQGGGVLLKQAREKGFEGYFMGADGLDASDMAKIAGDAVVDLIYTTTAGPAALFPDAKQFIEDYKAEYGVDPAPYAAEGYASTQIVLAAIEQVIKDNGGKLPTREEVAKAVRATKELDTIIGKITFDANGDPEVANYYILKATSSNPDDWGKNEIIFTTTAPSPLTKGAEGTMEAMDATMEATAAQ